MIVLPWRPPTLGEPPDRPPAEVIVFPVREADPPQTPPPRLAV